MRSILALLLLLPLALTAAARSLEDQADQLRQQMTFFTLDRRSA